MRIAILLLLFFPFLSLSWAQLEITDIHSANESIEDHIVVFADSSNELSIGQIRSEALLTNFIHLSRFTEEKDNSNTYWIHFSMVNKLEKSALLGLDFDNYNQYVNVYYLWGDSLEAHHTGFYRSGHENDEIIPVTNIVQLSDRELIDIFISIKNITDEKPVFQIQLVDIREQFKNNLYKKIFDAFLLGMMGIMILYGLFLFLHNRDRIYLYYTLYIIFLYCWYIFCFEFGYSLFPNLSRKIFPYSDIPAFIAFIFYLQFASAFLNLPEKLPSWSRIFRKLQFTLLICILVVFTFMVTTKRMFMGYMFGSGFFIIMIVIMVVFIIRLFHSKIQFSRILILGSSLLMTGMAMSITIWILNNDNSMIYQKAGTILELIVFTYGISLRYKVLKEENSRIQEKANQELEGKVKERTLEIAEQNATLQDQNEEIKVQNELLSLQHNSIQESIRYASRIQSAILPQDETLHHFLPKHFILFKPRDVVSGDFYWLGSKGENIIIAAVDCTGHGVPGAFMSMLGSSLLNEIINSQPPLPSNEILNELRDRIILSLRQTGKEGETKDGMDMGLCIIDRNHYKLTFSGAHNNLIIIRNGELRELKGDRMPIGISSYAGKPFNRHEYDLVKGDTIYMYSDGFPDQFGGPKGKKFLISRFKQVLLDIQDQIMYEQKESLEKELHDWMNPGDPSAELFDQIDDILVIGIKI